jgi:hypothetical protein
MPPIQPSIRGSLLTGASALALSISGSGAQAQSTAGFGSQGSTIWVEGGLFATAGGSYNIPSIPGLGAPFTSFNPQGGIEGAFGLDYRLPNDPAWHYVFDFRYGQSRTASSNSSSSSSSSSVFGSLFYFSSIKTATTSTTQATEWESHFVADFMIGRDLGVGATPPELQFGIRIAALHAAAQARENSTSTSTSTPFYFLDPFPLGPSTTTTTSASAFAAWNSDFFGGGPRVAITGAVPIVGFWTFDYEAGVAELFGQRSLNFNMTTSTGGMAFTTTSPNVFVFNADAWVALSYWFTPHVKLSGGIRTDFYDSALATYNINTGAVQNISRDFWGPFLRLTGTF